MIPKLTPNPISLTLEICRPNDAYEIAHKYLTEVLHENPDKAPWKLDEWRKSLSGTTELYLLFPLATRRTKFLKEIARTDWGYEIFTNPGGA